MRGFGPLIVIGLGLVILFVGDKIANVGASVDNLISSKWTGWALLLGGGFWLYSSTGHFRRITS